MKNDTVVIAVADNGEGSSPVMPYTGIRVRGSDFARHVKMLLAAALLRCGFAVADCNPASDALDNQELAIRANRAVADACIVTSCSTFGSARRFNDVCGARMRFPTERTKRSRTLCEDICAALPDRFNAVTESRGMQSGVNCAFAEVSGGYLTCFDEAKLLLDPDIREVFAERIAAGVCEYFDMPYVRRDEVLCYPLIGAGRRGGKVQMLQCMLNANDMAVAVTGIYDSATERAVNEFCIANGKAAKAATPEVWRDLITFDRAACRACKHGSGALYIRRKLKAKLYLEKTSYAFDDQALAAIDKFCEENGLGKPQAQDGEISDDILNAISAVGGGRPRLI